MRRFRHLVRRSNTEPSTGRHAKSLGLRASYWPCLRGPFITFDIGSYRLDLWFGLPSYKEVSGRGICLDDEWDESLLRAGRRLRYAQRRGDLDQVDQSPGEGQRVSVEITWERAYTDDDRDQQGTIEGWTNYFQIGPEHGGLWSATYVMPNAGEDWCLGRDFASEAAAKFACERHAGRLAAGRRRTMSELSHDEMGSISTAFDDGNLFMTYMAVKRILADRLAAAPDGLVAEAEWDEGQAVGRVVSEMQRRYDDLVERIEALADEWAESSVNDHTEPCHDSEDCARCCADELRALLATPEGSESGGGADE